jgi:hypothetical protein
MLSDMRNISDDELAELEVGAVVTKMGDDEDEDYARSDDPVEVSPEEMGEEEAAEAPGISAGDLDD